MALMPSAVEKVFFTPELFAREQAKRMQPPRGRLLVASCRSGSSLGTGTSECGYLIPLVPLA